MNKSNITILSSEEEINNHLVEIQRRKPVIAKDNIFSKEMVKNLMDSWKQLKAMVNPKGKPSIRKVAGKNIWIVEYEDSATIIYPEEI